MKVFTQLGLALLAVIISAGVLVAQSQVADIGPKVTSKVTYAQTEDLFDLQFDYPVGVGGGEAGIETDGSYIYTSMWNGAGEFQKYGADGAWMETFTIAGSAGCRDIAYDGTYFYGGAASTTIFEMDFATASMISTFTGPAACRAVAYDSDDDAFYCNNWSDDITKFDKTGANLGSFPVGVSAASYYGMAYQSASLCGDGPFLWGHSQTGATQNELIQMDLPSGTETGLTFDVGSVANVGAGIAGGLAIHDGLVSGFYSMVGTSQNENIWGLELCASGPLPDDDLGVQSIVAPNTGVELTATEAVTVAVKNYGNNAQSTFDVSFNLDGGGWVTESVSMTINSGETYDHTFATTVDLSVPGVYNFEACVELAGDLNPDNDCKTKAVENLTPSLCVPAYSSGCSFGDGFTDFALEEIENYGSGCADLNGTGWSQYFGLGPAMLSAGETYTVTMATGYANNFTTIWIDFNDDLLLTADEKVMDNFEMVDAGVMYDVDIMIPADAMAGQHIMRARTNWAATCDDPCVSYSYGEAEDYYIVVGGGPELCVPEYSSGCSFGDGFTDFALEEIENYGTGCADLNGVGWSQYLGLGPATLEQGGTHTVTMATGYANNYTTIWIDFNDDLMLTDDEKVVDNYLQLDPGVMYDVDLMIPADAALGQHIMRARTNWNADCLDPCEAYSYGEAEDYFVNVVEGMVVTAECEDFDDLIVGGYVAGQLGGNWTTWGGAPGTAEDAIVSDMYSVSPSNSILVEGTTDLVHLITGANITTGKWSYSLNIYVPTGTTGYFNLQKDVVPGTEWGFQVMFEDDMTMVVDGGAAGAAIIPYSYDTWYHCEMVVDLTNDWMEFYVDGTMELEYQWTLGTFGTAGANTLGGSNIYANPGATGTPPGAHFDDICFEELDPGTTLNPPENLMAEVMGSDVSLTWDAPSGDYKAVIIENNNTNSSSYSEVGPNANNTPYAASDAQFDLLFDFPVGVGGGEAGIETDGEYIYTSMWNGAGEFQKYMADGTWVETFSIAGSAGCRDIAYDGTYFYGGAASTTIFEMDFATTTMVSTFTGPAACRAVAYNENDDAFYCNNWSDNITKFDKSGANLGSFPVGASAASYYGLAYDNYSGGTYLWGHSQTGATQNELIQMELPSGTETGLTFDVGSVANVGAGIAGGLAIDGSIVEGYWTFVGTSQNENIWGLELSGGGASDISYNVYRDGSMIGSSMTLNFDDMGLAAGTYEYYVTAVYPEGESGPSNTVTAVVEETTTGDCEDFDALTVGGYVAGQLGGNWTTWGGAPGTAEDAIVSDMYSLSPSNSILVEGTTDLVHLITGSNITSGKWSYSLNIYVPTGTTGYFNLQKDVVPGTEWGFQVMFEDDMTMVVDGGAAGAAIIPYSYDTWYHCEMIVDLNADWCQFYVDGTMELEYQWTLGTFGTAGANTLGGSNIYANPGATGTPPGAHFDDICFEELEPGFDPPAPMNLTGPVSVMQGEDIVLFWDEVGGGEWLQWDDGVYFSSVGLTSGGTFSVGSHWEPADLAAYDGFSLQMISFVPVDPDATYTLKVWTGAAGSTEVVSQDVTNFTIEEWNEVTLDDPIVIDASQDLWFGYETTHGAGTFPAGTDGGPANQGYGDMINTGSWASLYTLTGGALDYNWSLAGYASLGDGKAVQPIGKPANFAVSSGSFETSGPAAITSKFAPSEAKSLLGYNVYRDGAQIGFTEQTTYTDNISVVGVYDYNVTSVWDEGESMFSNTWTVDVETGVEEFLSNATTLFPNPATDVVNVRSDYTINAIAIYNHAGQVVAQEDVNSNNYQVNTSTYTPGIYFFQIDTDEGRFSKRIIIK